MIHLTTIREHKFNAISVYLQHYNKIDIPQNKLTGFIKLREIIFTGNMFKLIYTGYGDMYRYSMYIQLKHITQLYNACKKDDKFNEYINK